MSAIVFKKTGFLFVKRNLYYQGKPATEQRKTTIQE